MPFSALSSATYAKREKDGALVGQGSVHVRWRVNGWNDTHALSREFGGILLLEDLWLFKQQHTLQQQVNWKF